MRTWPRIREVLSFPDFRRLLLLRLTTQFGDGLFQAVLVGSVVFSPEKQSTTVGFAKALAILVIPYSALGPFAGVFIDRWSRRAILVATPLARAAIAFLVVPGVGVPVPFYAGALFVLSANRFLLTTASSVTPRLVPSRDLLTANSVSTVSGTFTRFAGVVIAGQVVDAIGYAPVVAVTAAAWIATSWFASRIETELSPRHEGTASLRRDLARVAGELAEGARRLFRTPRALAPIASVTWNQLLNGLMLVISLVVFRDRFRGSVASFSNVVAAGGVGILLGLASVNVLEGRLSRRAMMAVSFAVSGVPLLAIAFAIGRYDVLGASFLLGLSFAWLKVPADTMTQEAVPDRYRGRVFALYDLAQNTSGVIAALAAIGLVHAVRVEWLVAATGVLFMLWVPVIMQWLRRAATINVRAYAGSRADEVPRAVEMAGVEEPVEVERSWREERAGVRLLCFRLELPDGSRIEVSKPEEGGQWRLDRELAT